ncbi:hypothetical protein A1O1_04474 [Capronia coronata CBS 617.96]|uniref:M protein repeat protein n=1 Tax=Capronia coronata CBS 617.96 TaxID=1182541 RepID=W9YET8_9EURO|nr:uncharacterized protein A1O1_04474 [Capronia coronata CBS 617.96]EXJ91362.1 hypothetical protein A1O1_04474 [Capronia coronata CBS 617.96]
MDKHTTTRSGVADETRSRTTHASTKPLTRPTAPRLSTSTRPSTTSSVAKTVGGGSLSKPPARPATTATTTTTTTVRRPPSSTASSTTAAHQKRPSVSSVDEKPSGDEKTRAGISARPKRASVAPSTSAERSSTLKTVAATPARRTTIAPASSTRQSVTSPSGARKAPSTPNTSRSGITPRSRPLVSSTSRNAVGAGALAEKKRLSTIPASPAVKIDVEEPEDNKENASSQGEEKPKAPVRPALGSRQSTRSVMIEQKIREFELVNTMLQAAMTADGVEDEEQELIKQEASSTIAKLKSDLAKVREFERVHGRLPTEAELEDAQSAKEEAEPTSPTDEQEAEAPSAEGPLVAELQHELAQSEAHAEALQAELMGLKTKLEDSSKTADEESGRVQEVTEAIRAEYVAKIAEMTSLHEEQVRKLESTHQNSVQELRNTQESGTETLKKSFSHQLAEKESKFEELKSQLDEALKAASAVSLSKEAEVDKLRAELEEMRTATAKDQAAKDAEIEALKLDLETKKIDSEAASQTSPSPASSPAHNQELADAQQKLAAAKARHQAAKENAKSKIARLQEDFDNKVNALEGKHKEQIGELQDRQKQAEQDVTNKQKELAQQQEEYAKVSEEMARQSQVMQTLRDQVLDFEQSKKVESDAQTALITQLQDEINHLRQEKADEAATAASSLAAAEKAHVEKIQATEDRLNQVQKDLKNAEALHENKLQEVLKKSADDLSAANAELETSKTSHADRLHTLEADVQKANELAAMKQSENDGALSDLQHQLDTATTALKEAMTKHESLLKEHESTGSAAQDELAVLKATHSEELDRLRTEYQMKHDEEIAALEMRHAEQVQQLEQKIHSSQKELATVKETHAGQIKQLEQQTKASLADLETLEAGHLEELDRVKTEAEQLRLKAAEEAELKYTEKLQQLEKRLSAAEAELSEARSTYAKQIEDFEKQKGLDQESALDALKESHSIVLKDLEEQLRLAREAAETVTADHAERLKQVEQQLSARHAEELESLRTEHATKLEEAENLIEQALEEVRSSLLEENRQLVSQSKSLQADLDGTRFQIQSLKSILQSMEEEAGEKDQEHAVTVEKMEQELSMSVMKLAEQSARMMDLKMQHDQALAEAKKVLQDQSRQEMENLRADHEKALADLRSTLKSEHNQLIDKIRGEHATSVEASQSERQSEHEEIEKKLKEEHARQLDEVMKALETQWKAQVELLEEQNAAAGARLAQAIKDHEEALQATKSEHDATVARLQSQLQDAHAATQDTTELEGLRGQLSNVQTQVKEIEQKHAEAMILIQDRESTLAVMKQELNAAREAAEKRRDPAEVEELNNKFITAQNALDDLQVQHDQSVRDVQAEYDGKLEELFTELNAVKEDKQQAQLPDTTELDAVTARLEDAKKTITSLETQLDGAMLEVETQRHLAEDAQKEAEQIKQLQKQMDVVALPSPKSRRKSRSPKRRSMNPLSPGIPQQGLESSRWASEPDKDHAAAGDATPSSTTGQAVPPADTASGVQQGQGANDVVDTATETTSAGPDGPAAAATKATTGKRNVAGQLAGIQEQIKQLDDLSEDFLEEHQNMAKMLSRVDDGTTNVSTSTVKVEEDENDE